MLATVSSTTQPQLALPPEHAWAASICRDSFSFFVQELWGEIIAEELVWGFHMDVICDELQTAAERVFRGLPKEYDLIFNVPPGTTKSTIASVMFPAWVWTRMPSARSICASYAYPLAMDLSRRSRDVVLSDKYRLYFPEVALREDQNTKGHFANTAGGMRYACGAGGSVTGMHGHFLLPDDPIDPNRAMSEAELKAVNAWMSETLQSRKIDKQVSVMAMVMQRLHQDDPTGNRLAKKRGGKIRHICLPAEDHGEGESLVKPAALREQYTVTGGRRLLDPVRLSADVLDEAMAELGQYGYAAQFGQSPIARGGNMFKTDRLIIDDPPMGAISRIVRYWDKAGTHKAGCFTAGVKMGVEMIGRLPRYWVLNVARGQWDTDERENVIHQTAQADGLRTVVAVEQEPGSSGKESALATVRRLTGYRVRVDRPTGDKVVRADPFSAQVNGGNVRLAPGDWNQEYIDEMRFFPASKYKDQIDASSGAFAELNRMRTAIGAL